MSTTNSSRNQSTKTAEPSAWPVEGSTSYYALRHCPKQVKHHILAARQLIDSVGYCLLEVSEPTVAEKKIHWWHEEIARLAAKEPRHPATKRYQDFFNQLSAGEQQQATSSLLTVLSCHSEEKFNTMADQTSFEELLISDGRAKHCLVTLAHLKSIDAATEESGESENNNIVRAKGEPVQFIAPQAENNKARRQAAGAQTDDDLLLGLSVFHRLATFHKLYHAGLPVWPDDLYKQYNLSPENVKQKNNTENLLELQSALFDQTIARLEQAQLSLIDSASVKGAPINSSDNMAIYSAIRLAQLRMWKKNRTNLLEQYRTVTPLKKAWICWRLQHQLGKKK